MWRGGKPHNTEEVIEVKSVGGTVMRVLVSRD